MTRMDDDLVAAYLQGDIEAFRTLFDRNDRPLLRFVLSLGGSQAQAEDVAQTTWLRVITRIETYRPIGRFRSWLFRIAHRIWLDTVRSAWERKRVPLDGSEYPDFEGVRIALEAFQAKESPEEHALHNERTQLLYTALDELPDLMRQTVLLRVDSELSFREISEVMDCPLGTALWRMNEAERRLKKWLDTYHG